MEKDNQKDSAKGQDLSFIKDNNKSFIFICQKTEKLTSALYRVTEFLPDHEPLKLNLRSLSNNILISLACGQSGDDNEKLRAINMSLKNFPQVVSLMAVAVNSGV